MHTDTRPAVLVPVTDARAIHGYLLAHLSDLVVASCTMDETPAGRTLTCQRAEDWHQITGLVTQIRGIGTALAALPAPRQHAGDDWLADLLTGSATLKLRGATA